MKRERKIIENEGKEIEKNKSSWRSDTFVFPKGEGLVVFRKIERERENVTTKLRGSKGKTLLLIMHTCMYSTYIVHTSKLVSMLNYRIKLTQID